MKFWVAAVVLTFTATVVTPAESSVLVTNAMQAPHNAAAPGIEAYQYGTGTQHIADFSTGTHVGTRNNSGVLEVDVATVFGDWWDVAYQRRQCFTVNLPPPAIGIAEYPLRFDVDTSGTSSTGADIRVLEGPNGAQLPSYSEGPFPSTTSVVYAQAQPLPAGVSTYCVYFDNASVPSVSDELGTFTYHTGQTISHYTMTDRFRGGGADSRVTVVSYTDNNTVSDGTTNVTLNTGQLQTFSGLNQQSVITSTGPIDASYDRPSKETLLPEAYADNQFTFPTNRYAERFWIRSPHGNTTVEAVSNGVVIGSVAVGPASGAVVLNAPGPGAQYVSLRSTDGTDFLAVHLGTNQQDVFIGVPWFGDTLYGVASTRLKLGTTAATTVSWIRSDGGANPAQAVPLNPTTNISGNGAFGNGRAYAITGNSYFAAAQQADNDGTETTSFLPSRLLSQTYRTPIQTRYFTVACPIPGTNISINGGPAATCAGTGVGHFYSGFGTQAAGTLIQADNPVFVYMEARTARDEQNLLGIKAHIPYARRLTVTPSPVEIFNGGCGVWTSTLLPTAGVYGTTGFTATTPAGTTATFQISTNGSPVYGPDGTAATSFVTGDLVPYVADFTGTLQLQLQLCAPNPSTLPTASDARIENNLLQLAPTVSAPASLALSSPAAGTDEAVLRIYQQSSGAWQGNVQYRTGAGLANTTVTFTTDHPTTQVTVIGGVPASPSPTFSHAAAQPYTLRANHSTTAGQSSQVDLALVDVAGVQVEMGVQFNFVG